MIHADPSLRQAYEKKITTVFPKTLACLTEIEQHRFFSDFLNQFSLDQLHFVPMLLKQQRKPLACIQIADYEFLQDSIRNQDWGALKYPGWHLDPSAQRLLFTKGAQVLGKPVGVYVLWNYQGQVLEIVLSEKKLCLFESYHADEIWRPDLEMDLHEEFLALQKIGIIRSSKSAAVT